MYLSENKSSYRNREFVPALVTGGGGCVKLYNVDRGLAPVVQSLDNAIHWINHYSWVSVDKTNHAIHWIVIYPVDSVIHLSNNLGLLDIPNQGAKRISFPFSLPFIRAS